MSKKGQSRYIERPNCDKHKDCFANRNGKCVCLIDNNFGSKDCPFYKKEET